MTNCCGKCCLLFLAIFCPPIAVAIHMGCGSDMCINWCLTFLLYFPGLIHAWVVILSKEREDCHTVVHVHQTAPAAAPAAAPIVVLQAPPQYQPPPVNYQPPPQIHYLPQPPPQYQSPPQCEDTKY